MSREVLAAVLAAASITVLAACGSPASSASIPPSALATAAPSTLPMSSPPTVVTPGPLTLGAFPSTTDGQLARRICEAWAGLRDQYAANIVNDSPYQLNQWFSGAAWSAVNSDGEALGDDPAYSHLETALGVATVGDMASTANAALLDKACEDAD